MQYPITRMYTPHDIVMKGEYQIPAVQMSLLLRAAQK